ncbi:sugar epimerase [Zobellia russellii]|uniref:sugar epimerase n=1 Tax=Zobellia russellii TaxID=248907 RepID=UPI0037DCE16F
MIFHKKIKGSNFSDERGGLIFFNDFDMTEVIRMYEISPSDIKIIRGWQAHQEEKKWFYCNTGSFIMNIVRVNDFDSPSPSINAEKFLLDAKIPSVLEISGGYATAFKAQTENSKLIVFSNFSLEESKNDDYRFSIDQWSANWQ